MIILLFTMVISPMIVAQATTLGESMAGCVPTLRPKPTVL
jgi:hypothetical protein